MASESIQVRVFVASPGGLDEERDLFRESITKFNNEYGHEAGFVFVWAGWEQVSSGVGRPQDLINEKVRTADFMVTVIWDRWGTATTKDATFSSGTQEELATAIECLSDPRAPMRDIAIYFRGVNERQLADAGPQLEQVIEFKQNVERSRQILYNRFDKTSELEQLFARQLRTWQQGFSAKVPRDIRIPNLTGVSIDNVSDSSSDQEVGQQLARAQELERQGLVTEAEIAYAIAIAADDRVSLVAYAKFLRRTGRLERALDTNERILNLEALGDVDLTSSAVERSTVLANMAVIQRKLRKLEESRGSLEEAIKAAGAREDNDCLAAEAYAQDNLGLTLRQLGDISSALSKHETALSLRQQLGDEVGIAKCAINMARICRSQGELTNAREKVENAIAILKDNGAEIRTLANAYSALGEIAVAEADMEGARRHFQACLDLNDDLRHADGSAIACSQLAGLLLSMENIKEARHYAERCLRINERSGNLAGIDIALETLREIDAVGNS